MTITYYLFISMHLHIIELCNLHVSIYVFRKYRYINYDILFYILL